MLCLHKFKKHKKPQDIKSIKKQIIEFLENGDQSSRTLLEKLDCEEKDMKTVLKLLLEHQIITITATNTYKLSHL